MPLDERTLRYIASRNPALAERYASLPGARLGGYVNPDRPTLARALQDLGGIGGRQTIVAGNSPQQTINVNTAARVPAGAAAPGTPDEAALTSQAGWAGANEAVAPYLGDWRATPAQVLSAAVAGYGKARYAAQQDIAAQRQQQQLFDLKKQELDANVAESQAKAQQREALLKEIEAIQDPVERRIAMLNPEGWATARAKTLFPEPPKPVSVGNDLVDPTTGRVIHRAPFAPREPREDPPVAVQGPNGPVYVPRSQAFGMAPADTRELAGTEGEREDKRMLDIAGRVGAAGSWEGVSPEDRSWYGLKYRERAAPKFGLDPNTGLVIQTNPDMSSLPLPSEMQPHAEPAAVAEPSAPIQPVLGDRETDRPATGGQTIMNKEGAREPVPTVDNGPPSSAAQPPKLAYGPAAGRVPIQQGPTKEQTSKFNDALTARNDMVAATGRLRELLRENGGQTALVGESATKFRIAAQQIVTALGGLGNAGVLQPSDIDRFTAMFGDPTSLTGYFGNMTGLKPLTSALDELDGVVAKKVQNRASEAGVKVFKTEEEAEAGIDALPPGTKFVGPDGKTYVKGQ